MKARECCAPEALHSTRTVQRWVAPLLDAAKDLKVDSIALWSSGLQEQARLRLLFLTVRLELAEQSALLRLRLLLLDEANYPAIFHLPKSPGKSPGYQND